MSRTVYTDEERVALNHEVPLAEQQAALSVLRKQGVAYKEKNLTYWHIGNEFISPRVLVDRVNRGFYGSKESSDKRTETDEADLQPHKGRNLRSVGEGQLDSNTNKRGRKQRRVSSDGSGASGSDGEVQAGPKKVSRQKAKSVGKSRSSVSKSESSNRSDKASLGRNVGRKVNRKKPRRARQHRRA